MKNYRITVNGVAYDVSVEEIQTDQMGTATAAPLVSPVAPAPAAPAKKAPAAASGSAGSVEVKAPMPGKIVDVKVKPGDTVKKGDVAAVLEAMKMENEIGVPQDGTIATVDMPLTPQMKGNLATVLYLRGITQEDRQRQRDEILAADANAIRALAPIVEACMKKDTYCVFGGEEKVRENEKIFSRVVRAME